LQYKEICTISIFVVQSAKRNSDIKFGEPDMSLLSIVVPAYNEEESIEHFAPAIRKVLEPENINFEIIFIDDGSTDNTFDKIKEQSVSSDNVRGYRFSRNFGKESAIWAGLKHISGDCCVVMDCDLQHPPETLPEMYRLWEKGFEVIEGVKAHRGKEFFLIRLFSGCFYRIISPLSGFDMQSSSDYKLLDKRVVDELIQLTEQNAFFRGLSFWVGFNSTKIKYDVAPRIHGKTKWGFLSLAKYAVNNIVGFSTAPLHIVTGIGAIMIIAFLALSIQTLVNYFSGLSLEGFTTVILLLLLIGGSLMISLGIVGIYIAKIYEEVKRRPRFIISESTDS